MESITSIDADTSSCSFKCDFIVLSKWDKVFVEEAVENHQQWVV